MQCLIPPSFRLDSICEEPRSTGNFSMIELVCLWGTEKRCIHYNWVVIFSGIKKWRTPSNVLLANLATADLIVNLWTFPITLASVMRGNRAVRVNFCRVNYRINITKHNMVSWGITLQCRRAYAFFVIVGCGSNWWNANFLEQDLWFGKFYSMTVCLDTFYFYCHGKRWSWG